MKPVNESLIISDFDNTFINFKKVDKRIIVQIFNFHVFVLALDRFLWKVNDIGFFGNSIWGLKLRLLVYAFFTNFSLHPLKYKNIMNEYEKKYKKYALEQYQIKKDIISLLYYKGYDFLILTNNELASNIGIKNIIYFKSKRKYLKNNIPKYLVGDNFWDDYRNCPKNSQYINIGRGGFIKKHCKKAICFDTIEELAFNI